VARHPNILQFEKDFRAPADQAGTKLPLNTKHPQRAGAVVANNEERKGSSLDA